MPDSNQIHAMLAYPCILLRVKLCSFVLVGHTVDRSQT